jgi:Ca2+-binding RTX toxin-like protein
MAVLDATAATEAVRIHVGSNQINFNGQDGGGNQTPTQYSWLSTRGDDLQARGSGMDHTSDPPGFGVVDVVEIDLSNDDYANPDVVIDDLSVPAQLSVLTGGALQFCFELFGSDDEFTGSSFGDVFSAGGGNDLMTLGAGNDTAYGDAGDDTLLGGLGNDTLNGHIDADHMDGGDGNDLYFVENVGDEAEDSGTGIDLVKADITHALTPNIENLTIIGAAAVDGIGNALANVITGNGASNNLSGGGAIDTLNGGGGGDILDGGTDADVMSGGLGDDIYVVDTAGEIVLEGAGGGSDTVTSSISYALGAGVEDLVLFGSANINGTGSFGANLLTGGTGANLLTGDAGADTLTGGDGFDTLNGGAGPDVFDFNDVAESGPSSAAADVITAFQNPGAAVGDLIDLSSIDAIAGVAGSNFNFVVVPQNPFPPGTAAGSLWVRNEGGDTIVYGNVDLDLDPELAIRITDGAIAAGTYSAADFAL